MNARPLILVIASALVAGIALAELPFLEPTRDEWERMTPAERQVAHEKLIREWARQREESTKFIEDQKSGICHVHKIKMELHTVKIQYGLPTPSSESPIPRNQIPKLLAAVATEFPNADDLRSRGLRCQR
jgi:hypothetical protein